MKTLQKITSVIVLIGLFASCQSSPDIKQLLSKSETRREIMDTIANNIVMSQEMMTVMMNSRTGRMMMHGNEDMTMMMMENNETMMKMMKDNPGIMQSTMSDMIETCKNDSVMMSGLCKTMIGNQQMMDMMNKIMVEDKGMNKMKGMNN